MHAHTRQWAPEDVLDYWFSARLQQHWFASTPALDREIKQRYAALWEQAAKGELDAWRATPKGSLALAILLDQFPLNMFRGTPASFSTEAKAIEVTLHAVAHGLDKQLEVGKRLFSVHAADAQRERRASGALDPAVRPARSGGES